MALAESRIGEDEIIDNYLKNNVPNEENKYIYLLKSLKPYLTPYDNPDIVTEMQNLSTQDVETAITSVVDNRENFESSVAKDDSIISKRFLIQEYSLGQNMLKTYKSLLI